MCLLFSPVNPKQHLLGAAVRGKRLHVLLQWNHPLGDNDQFALIGRLLLGVRERQDLEEVGVQ